MDGFIGLAGRGKNDWWRYLISIALVAFFWLVIGSFALIAVVVINGGPPFPWDGKPAVPGPLVSFDPFLTFYLPVAFSFISLAAALIFAVRFIHSRPPITLITPRKSMDPRRLALGFGIFLAMNLISNAASYLFEPQAFSFTLDPGRMLAFAPIYILLTIVQTTAEEMLFRRYLLQGLGTLLRKPYAAAILSTMLFLLVHAGNPPTRR